MKIRELQVVTTTEANGVMAAVSIFDVNGRRVVAHATQRPTANEAIAGCLDYFVHLLCGQVRGENNEPVIFRVDAE